MRTLGANCRGASLLPLSRLMGLGLLNRIRDVLLALALVLLFPPVRSRGAAGTGLRKSPRGILELNFFLCYTVKKKRVPLGAETSLEAS